MAFPEPVRWAYLSSRSVSSLWLPAVSHRSQFWRPRHFQLSEPLYAVALKFRKQSFIRLDALALSVIATATWLAGWLGVCHSRYCIITTKRIWKLFRPSDSIIIEAFGTLTAIQNSKGTPSAGALNTRAGVGKLAIFVRFSTEMAVYLGNG